MIAFLSFFEMIVEVPLSKILKSMHTSGIQQKIEFWCSKTLIVFTRRSRDNINESCYRLIDMYMQKQFNH